METRRKFFLFKVTYPFMRFREIDVKAIVSEIATETKREELLLEFSQAANGFHNFVTESLRFLEESPSLEPDTPFAVAQNTHDDTLAMVATVLKEKSSRASRYTTPFASLETLPASSLPFEFFFSPTAKLIYSALTSFTRRPRKYTELTVTQLDSLSVVRRRRHEVKCGVER
jgi:hypothetical protein